MTPDPLARYKPITDAITRLKLSAQNLGSKESVIGPYEKAEKKGQRIRAITSVLQDSQGTSIVIM